MQSLSVGLSLTVHVVSAEVPPPAECEDAEDLYGPDVKAELPSHLSVTKDVMERCIHLLSDPSLRLRLKVPPTTVVVLETGLGLQTTC